MSAFLRRQIMVWFWLAPIVSPTGVSLATGYGPNSPTAAESHFAPDAVEAALHDARGYEDKAVNDVRRLLRREIKGRLENTNHEDSYDNILGDSASKNGSTSAGNSSSNVATSSTSGATEDPLTRAGNYSSNNVLASARGSNSSAGTSSSNVAASSTSVSIGASPLPATNSSSEEPPGTGGSHVSTGTENSSSQVVGHDGSGGSGTGGDSHLPMTNPSNGSARVGNASSSVAARNASASTPSPESPAGNASSNVRDGSDNASASDSTGSPGTANMTGGSGASNPTTGISTETGLPLYASRSGDKVLGTIALAHVGRVNEFVASKAAKQAVIESIAEVTNASVTSVSVWLEASPEGWVVAQFSIHDPENKVSPGLSNDWLGGEVEESLSIKGWQTKPPPVEGSFILRVADPDNFYRNPIAIQALHESLSELANTTIDSIATNLTVTTEEDAKEHTSVKIVNVQFAIEQRAVGDTPMGTELLMNLGTEVSQNLLLRGFKMRRDSKYLPPVQGDFILRVNDPLAFCNSREARGAVIASLAEAFKVPAKLFSVSMLTKKIKRANNGVTSGTVAVKFTMTPKSRLRLKLGASTILRISSAVDRKLPNFRLGPRSTMSYDPIPIKGSIVLYVSNPVNFSRDDDVRHVLQETVARIAVVPPGGVMADVTPLAEPGPDRFKPGPVSVSFTAEAGPYQKHVQFTVGSEGLERFATMLDEKLPRFQVSMKPPSLSEEIIEGYMRVDVTHPKTFAMKYEAERAIADAISQIARVQASTCDAMMKKPTMKGEPPTGPVDLRFTILFPKGVGRLGSGTVDATLKRLDSATGDELSLAFNSQLQNIGINADLVVQQYRATRAPPGTLLASRFGRAPVSGVAHAIQGGITLEVDEPHKFSTSYEARQAIIDTLVNLTNVSRSRIDAELEPQTLNVQGAGASRMTMGSVKAKYVVVSPSSSVGVVDAIHSSIEEMPLLDLSHAIRQNIFRRGLRATVSVSDVTAFDSPHFPVSGVMQGTMVFDMENPRQFESNSTALGIILDTIASITGVPSERITLSDPVYGEKISAASEGESAEGVVTFNYVIRPKPEDVMEVEGLEATPFTTVADTIRWKVAHSTVGYVNRVFANVTRVDRLHGTAVILNSKVAAVPKAPRPELIGAKVPVIEGSMELWVSEPEDFVKSIEALQALKETIARQAGIEFSETESVDITTTVEKLRVTGSGAEQILRGELKAIYRILPPASILSSMETSQMGGPIGVIRAMATILNHAPPETLTATLNERLHEKGFPPTAEVTSSESTIGVHTVVPVAPMSSLDEQLLLKGRVELLTSNADKMVHDEAVRYEVTGFLAELENVSNIDLNATFDVDVLSGTIFVSYTVILPVNQKTLALVAMREHLEDASTDTLSAQLQNRFHSKDIPFTVSVTRFQIDAVARMGAMPATTAQSQISLLGSVSILASDVVPLTDNTKFTDAVMDTLSEAFGPAREEFTFMTTDVNPASNTLNVRFRITGELDTDALRAVAEHMKADDITSRLNKKLLVRNIQQACSVMNVPTLAPAGDQSGHSLLEDPQPKRTLPVVEGDMMLEADDQHAFMDSAESKRAVTETIAHVAGTSTTYVDVHLTHFIESMQAADDRFSVHASFTVRPAATAFLERYPEYLFMQYACGECSNGCVVENHCDTSSNEEQCFGGGLWCPGQHNASFLLRAQEKSKTKFMTLTSYPPGDARAMPSEPGPVPTLSSTESQAVDLLMKLRSRTVLTYTNVLSTWLQSLSCPSTGVVIKMDAHLAHIKVTTTTTTLPLKLIVGSLNFDVSNAYHFIGDDVVNIAFRDALASIANVSSDAVDVTFAALGDSTAQSNFTVTFPAQLGSIGTSQALSARDTSLNSLRSAHSQIPKLLQGSGITQNVSVLTILAAETESNDVNVVNFSQAEKSLYVGKLDIKVTDGNLSRFSASIPIKRALRESIVEAVSNVSRTSVELVSLEPLVDEARGVASVRFQVHPPPSGDMPTIQALQASKAALENVTLSDVQGIVSEKLGDLAAAERFVPETVGWQVQVPREVMAFSPSEVHLLEGNFVLRVDDVMPFSGNGEAVRSVKAAVAAIAELPLALITLACRVKGVTVVDCTYSIPFPPGSGDGASASTLTKLRQPEYRYSALLAQMLGDHGKNNKTAEAIPGSASCTDKVYNMTAEAAAQVPMEVVGDLHLAGIASSNFSKEQYKLVLLRSLAEVADVPIGDVRLASQVEPEDDGEPNHFKVAFSISVAATKSEGWAFEGAELSGHELEGHRGQELVKLISERFDTTADQPRQMESSINRFAQDAKLIGQDADAKLITVSKITLGVTFSLPSPITVHGQIVLELGGLEASAYENDAPGTNASRELLQAGIAEAAGIDPQDVTIKVHPQPGRGEIFVEYTIRVVATDDTAGGSHAAKSLSLAVMATDIMKRMSHTYDVQSFIWGKLQDHLQNRSSVALHLFHVWSTAARVLLGSESVWDDDPTAVGGPVSPRQLGNQAPEVGGSTVLTLSTGDIIAFSQNAVARQAIKDVISDIAQVPSSRVAIHFKTVANLEVSYTIAAPEKFTANLSGSPEWVFTEEATEIKARLRRIQIADFSQAITDKLSKEGYSHLIVVAAHHDVYGPQGVVDGNVSKKCYASKAGVKYLCIFPFTFAGELYESCTNRGVDTVYWCDLGGNHQGTGRRRWGTCEPNSACMSNEANSSTAGFMIGSWTYPQRQGSAKESKYSISRQGARGQLVYSEQVLGLGSVSGYVTSRGNNTDTLSVDLNYNTVGGEEEPYGIVDLKLLSNNSMTREFASVTGEENTTSTGMRVVPTVSPTRTPTIWINKSYSYTFMPTPETAVPTPIPTTRTPTSSPTRPPHHTPAPTPPPTSRPTHAPDAVPTPLPTSSPTQAPTPGPTSPTASPTPLPPGHTHLPTPIPTSDPTPPPTPVPTDFPTTSSPTEEPTANPTIEPTEDPTLAPTQEPTNAPTFAPTPAPSTGPTTTPTEGPTDSPTGVPTTVPTNETTPEPTGGPPTAAPTNETTPAPSATPAPTGALQVTATISFECDFATALLVSKKAKALLEESFVDLTVSNHTANVDLSLFSLKENSLVAGFLIASFNLTGPDLTKADHQRVKALQPAQFNAEINKKFADGGLQMNVSVKDSVVEVPGYMEELDIINDVVATNTTGNATPNGTTSVGSADFESGAEFNWDGMDLIGNITVAADDVIRFVHNDEVREAFRKAIATYADVDEHLVQVHLRLPLKLDPNHPIEDNVHARTLGAAGEFHVQFELVSPRNIKELKSLLNFGFKGPMNDYFTRTAKSKLPSINGSAPEFMVVGSEANIFEELSQAEVIQIKEEAKKVAEGKGKNCAGDVKSTGDVNTTSTSTTFIPTTVSSTSTLGEIMQLEGNIEMFVENSSLFVGDPLAKASVEKGVAEVGAIPDTSITVSLSPEGSLLQDFEFDRPKGNIIALREACSSYRTSEACPSRCAWSGAGCQEQTARRLLVGTRRQPEANVVADCRIEVRGQEQAAGLVTALTSSRDAVATAIKEALADVNIPNPKLQVIGLRLEVVHPTAEPTTPAPTAPTAIPTPAPTKVPTASPTAPPTVPPTNAVAQKNCSRVEVNATIHELGLYYDDAGSPGVPVLPGDIAPRPGKVCKGWEEHCPPDKSSCCLVYDEQNSTDPWQCYAEVTKQTCDTNGMFWCQRSTVTSTAAASNQPANAAPAGGLQPANAAPGGGHGMQPANAAPAGGLQPANAAPQAANAATAPGLGPVGGGGGHGGLVLSRSGNGGQGANGANEANGANGANGTHGGHGTSGGHGNSVATEDSSVGMKIMLENLAFDVVSNSATLDEKVKDAIRSSIATVSGTNNPNAVMLVLSSGSILADVVLRTPSTLDPNVVATALGNEELLDWTVQRNIAAVPGISAALSGTVSTRVVTDAHVLSGGIVGKGEFPGTSGHKKEEKGFAYWKNVVVEWFDKYGIVLAVLTVVSVISCCTLCTRQSVDSANLDEQGDGLGDLPSSTACPPSAPPRSPRGRASANRVSGVVRYL